MGIFRSEDMSYGTLVLGAEHARYYINALGMAANIQFVDMNAHLYHRPYKTTILQIDEVDRMVRSLCDTAKSQGTEVQSGDTESFVRNFPSLVGLDALEKDVRSCHERITTMNFNNTALMAEFQSAIDELGLHMLAVNSLSGSVDAKKSPGTSILKSPRGSMLVEPLLLGRSFSQSGGMVLGGKEPRLVQALAGIVKPEDKERFTRAVFRATRFNALLDFGDPESVTHTVSKLSAISLECSKLKMSGIPFVVYFQSVDEGSSALEERLRKICGGYGVSVFEWPDSVKEARHMVESLTATVGDKCSAVAAFSRLFNRELLELTEEDKVTGLCKLQVWRFTCAKERSVYASLDMFSSTARTLRANCWFLTEQEASIKAILASPPPETYTEKPKTTVGDKAGAQVQAPAPLPASSLRVLATLIRESTDTAISCPPTYIKKNAVSFAFQDLVDTYGIPAYGEINPAVFTIVSFPCLFGIMFGDIGHGGIILAIASIAVLYAKKLAPLKKHIGFLDPLLQYRYMLFAMGFFAVYAGFMYNDFFSLGVPIFKSRWVTDEDEGALGDDMLAPAPWFNSLNIRSDSVSASLHGPYPFGLDPAWVGAKNELLFVNSLKMKLSVLFGVVQMLLGVVLKFFNSVYFRNKTDFIFECIPQLAFLLAFFGYMDYMVMYKWVNCIDCDPELAGSPSIINSLISMGLGQRNPQPLYASQRSTEATLMLITMWAVPLMLIPKPLIMLWQHTKKQKAEATAAKKDDSKEYKALEDGTSGKSKGKEDAHIKAESHAHSESHGGGGHGGHDGEFNFSEILIHQVIGTIEFVLGTVSHTASYLRLWALSLAHQQLSLVFFQKTMIPALFSTVPLFNSVGLYIWFGVFFVVTLVVLLGMDVLECFLHTLRLHWVEFQSKFYRADGWLFQPFNHRATLLQAIQTS